MTHAKYSCRHLMESMTWNMTFPSPHASDHAKGSSSFSTPATSRLALPEHSNVHSTSSECWEWGREEEEKKSGKEKEVAGRREEGLFPYVYAPECEKEKKITSSFSLRSQMPLCVYLVTLTLTLEFEDNYFSSNTVAGCKHHIWCSAKELGICFPIYYDGLQCGAFLNNF